MQGRFITDFGSEQQVTDADTGNEVLRIPRYGVWVNKGRGKPEVLAVGNDLELLQRTYGVDSVISIPPLKGASAGSEAAKSMGAVPSTEPGRS